VRLVLLPALLAAAPLIAGCGRASSPGFPSVDRWEPARRQPDGIALDPLPAAVAPARRGDSGSPFALVLASPQPADAPLVLLRQLLDALVREDQAALTQAFSPRAVWINPAQAGQAGDALGHYRERLRRLDYGRLDGLLLFQEADVELYTFDDLEFPLPGRPARPVEMLQGDVYLRFHVLVPRLGVERFFADDMALIVRPEGGRLRVSFTFEDFPLP
jgi:hypothetical protein